MIGSWGAEHEYFVELIRSFLSAVENPPASPKNFDWEQFRRLVRRHRRIWQPLGPLIYKTTAPWELKIEMASWAKPMRDHTRSVMDECRRLCDALRRSGIAAVALKGPALACTVYGNSDLRYMGDLDLLVKREDVDKACREAQDLGYSFPTLRRSVSFYERHHFHHILTNAEGIQVEIHWDLTVPTDFVRFDLPGLFARAPSINKENVEMTILEPADMLLHSVSQALPSFDSVGRLLDASLLIRAGAAEEPQLAARARQQGLATPLWIMLQLATQVAGVAVPEKVKSAVRPGFLRRLCITSLPIKQRMIAGSGELTGINRLILLLCCPTAGATGSRLIRFVFPAEEDLLDMGLSVEDISRLQWASLHVRGAISVLKMVSYMIWRLVSQPLRRVAYWK